MLAIKKRLAAMCLDSTSLGQFAKLFEGLFNTQLLTSPALAVTAAAPALGAAIAAMIGGLLVTKISGTSMAALNGPNVPNAGTTWQMWIHTMDQAGTLYTYAGTPGATAAAVVPPFIPDVNGTSGLPQVAIGALVINNASVGAFIPGTTLLNVANLNPIAINTVGPFFPLQYM